MRDNVNFYVVVLGNNGELQEHGMRKWCLEHPEHISDLTDLIDIDTTLTSHGILISLLKQNWVAQGTSSKIRVMSPNVIKTKLEALSTLLPNSCL